MSAGSPSEALLKRASEVISGLSAVGMLLVSLSSDALSATWLLWLATAVCGACFVVVFAFQRPVPGTRSFAAFVVAFGGSAALLGAAWVFAFRDEIRFSKLVTSFSKAPSVLVDPRISRGILPSRAAGSPPQRFASYVDALVAQDHRTRICSAAECADSEVLFVVNGVLMDNGFALEFSLPGPTPASPKEPHPSALTDVLAEIDRPQTFLHHGLEPGTSVLRVEGQSESAQVAVQAVYHLATAVRLLSSADFRAADAHVKHLSLSRVLAPHTSREWILQGTLVAASYYHRSGDFRAALEVLRSGLEAFPKDERLAVAEAYLRMESAKLTAAPDTIAVSAPAETVPPASFPSLRAVFLARAGMFWEASEFFELAAQSATKQDEARTRFHLHLAAALLSALASGSPDLRGSRTLENAEQAARLYPGARLPRLLEAFGQALKESAARSEELFESLHRQAVVDAEIASAGYWRARAYAETGQLDKAERLLESITANRHADTATLGLYAEVLVGRGQHEAGLNRARLVVKEDVKDAKSNRLLGLDEAREASQVGNSHRQSLAKAALEHLSASIRSGGENDDVYFELSDIYRTLGKAAQARRSSRRALEFACSPGGEDLACRVVEIRNLLEAKKSSEATMSTNAMLSSLEETPQHGDELLRSWVLVQAAIAWYENKGLEEAEILYRNVIKDLKTSAPSSASRAVLSQVNCNVGFIHIDRGRDQQALAVFRDALSVRRQPDCEAGMAVALKLAGRHSEALAEYERARNADPTYETDIDMLKRLNQWSETACRHLRWLAAEYKRSRSRAVLALKESPI